MAMSNPSARFKDMEKQEEESTLFPITYLA